MLSAETPGSTSLSALSAAFTEITTSASSSKATHAASAVGVHAGVRVWALDTDDVNSAKTHTGIILTPAQYMRLVTMASRHLEREFPFASPGCGEFVVRRL